MTYVSEFRLIVRKSTMDFPGDWQGTQMRVELRIDGDEILGQSMIMSPEPDESEIDHYFRRAASALKAAIAERRAAQT